MRISMNGILAFIWLVIIFGNVLVRALKQRRGSGTGQMSGGAAGQQTFSGTRTNRAGNAEPRVYPDPGMEPAAKKRIKAPLQPLMQTHFTGREDLEPGYMYLNGVKVLIKEADRLEFLR
ncbi:MAG: hypothetical protein II868_01435 [Butyrivibrio sp.]|nr:hypothetical protein [Butyrivibrio sp.]